MQNHNPNDKKIGDLYIKDDILFVKHPREALITFEIAQEGLKKRLELCAGKTYPLIADSREVVNFTADARKLLSSPEGYRGLSAGAFIVKNQIQKFLGNLFIKRKKFPVPVRLFTNFDEAIVWLENYKPQRLN